MQNLNHLYIAIPLLDELDNIDLILKNIMQQSYSNFTLYTCVNQPNEWWEDNEKIKVCQRNIKSIDIIEKYSKRVNFQIIIIDKSTKGKGWQGNKLGVGWARKTLFDEIETIAKDDDIVISLDGDTEFPPNYFESINDNFSLNKNIDVLSIPYYHPLNKDNKANRAILRYEIYMRIYLLNLIRINSPYAFTALGSAIAFRVKALRKIGGFSPKKSGEDFYFLQKMVKYKHIGIWNEVYVSPEARFSDRVFFGTGPAMIKGNLGDWTSYPIYSMELFDKIKLFYSIIPDLFIKNIQTPIDEFLLHISIDRNQIWDKLRLNNKDLPHFTKAIHDFFDGLRILQFLKYSYKTNEEEANLRSFLIANNFEKSSSSFNIEHISFETSSIVDLNTIRDYLCRLENEERKRILL